MAGKVFFSVTMSLDSPPRMSTERCPSDGRLDQIRFGHRVVAEPGFDSGEGQGSVPSFTQRWNRSICWSGQAPSQGMLPARSRSRIAVACRWTSS